MMPWDSGRLDNELHRQRGRVPTAGDQFLEEGRRALASSRWKGWRSNSPANRLMAAASTTARASDVNTCPGARSSKKPWSPRSPVAKLPIPARPIGRDNCSQSAGPGFRHGHNRRAQIVLTCADPRKYETRREGACEDAGDFSDVRSARMCSAYRQPAGERSRIDDKRQEKERAVRAVPAGSRAWVALGAAAEFTPPDRRTRPVRRRSSISAPANRSPASNPALRRSRSRPIAATHQTPPSPLRLPTARKRLERPACVDLTIVVERQANDLKHGAILDSDCVPMRYTPSFAGV